MATNVAVLRRRKSNKGFGAKLARHLNAYQVTAGHRPKERLNIGCTIFNYGTGWMPIWDRPDLKWVNHPTAVAASADKTHTFRHLFKNGVPCLEWTTNTDAAKGWRREGEIVYARTLLRASKGKGIELNHPKLDAVWHDAPLYTKHFHTKHEFRVFVGGVQCLDIIQKKRMGAEKLKEHGIEEADDLRRNYDRGWVFAHQDLSLTPDQYAKMGTLAVAAIAAVGLDWGAVDTLMDRHGNMVVCETNSSPALDAGTTWEKLVPWFERQVGNANIG